MLNKNYKLGSSWKLVLLLPFIAVALIAISCSENESPEFPEDAGIKVEVDDNGRTHFEIPEIATFSEQHDEDGQIFYIVEEMPTFNGGDAAEEFRKYIAVNLKYPEIAIQNRISGRVIVQFTINSEGKVVDAVLVRSVDPALDKEAIRVVMSSPEWTPGKLRGKDVSVLFTFPINFSLQ